MSVIRRISDISKELDLAVHTLSSFPEMNNRYCLLHCQVILYANPFSSEGIYQITIFREEATSGLAGFHVVLFLWSNWNLEMLVFVEEGGGGTGEPGENPSEQDENQQ